jgi:hypothetical protein
MLNNDSENKLPLPPDATDFASNPTEFTAKHKEQAKQSDISP